MNMIQPRHILHWLRLYKLYRQAFPRYERKPFGIIRSMQKKGNVDIWYFEKDGKFVGLAFTVNREEAILLDYLAIVPNRRGEGIGSEIIAQLQRHYAEKGIFVEIESVFADSDNLEERLQRKQFYLNNGMIPMKVMVVLFGVEMELLGLNCKLTFEEYYTFYHDVFGNMADNHVKRAEYPEDVQNA